ncbi:MAG: hypothetical protein LBJ16_03300 [Holosporaceae bacterium]|nr:hypothetical protein [Holosporaceae bacterium]
MKLFAVFICGSLLPLLEANNSTSLQLKAVIDPVVNIIRIDNEDEELDVLKGPSANFSIVSNGGKGAEIVFNTAHNWRLQKSDDESKVIEYKCLVDSEELDTSSGTGTVSVAEDKFDGSRYNFKASFHVKDSDITYESGSYADTVNISVNSLG